MINSNYWLSKPQETRRKLAEAFGMKFMGGVVVDGGIVRNDGYINQIYDTFTVAKMQAFTGSTDTDIYKLFEMCVDKVEGKVENVEPPQEPVQEVKEEVKEEPIKKTKKTKK